MFGGIVLFRSPSDTASAANGTWKLCSLCLSIRFNVRSRERERKDSRLVLSRELRDSRDVCGRELSRNDPLDPQVQICSEVVLRIDISSVGLFRLRRLSPDVAQTSLLSSSRPAAECTRGILRRENFWEFKFHCAGNSGRSSRECLSS